MASARRKAITMGGVSGAVVLVVASSLAWACTGLATLSSSSSSATAGQKVEISGEGFAKQGEVVSVHFDSGWGDVMATAQPDRNGRFQASVEVPELTPGEHVLLAVQPDMAGNAIVATGSLPLNVVADFEGVTAAVPVSAGVPPGSAEPPWIPLATVGLVAGVLLAVGVSFAMQKCRAMAPSTVAVTDRKP